MAKLLDIGKLVAVVTALGAAQVAANENNKMEQKDAKAVVTAAASAGKEEIKEAQATVDVLTNQEPFYMSVQWWVGATGVVISAAGAIGYTLPAEIQKEVLAIVAAVAGAGVTLAMAYNRYIRFRGVVK